MAVDDLWMKKVNGKKVPSARHGRGKRWRVRNDGARTVLFDRKPDAERYDATVRADLARGLYVDPRDGEVTVSEQAVVWRGQQLHRGSTGERVEQAFRIHVDPLPLGKMPIARVRPSHVKAWVLDRSKVLAPSTLRVLYSGYLAPLFAAAAADRLIGASPCVGIRLPEVENSEYVIATPAQVQALVDALPERYRAVPLLVAGCGPRAAEAFGLEVDAVDFLRREVHVRHQLVKPVRQPPHLGPPKTKTSRRRIDMASVVGEALSRHIAAHPPLPQEMRDLTDPRKPKTRPVSLLFTDEDGSPMTSDAWSRIWRPARKAAGLPERFGLRDLRHYFATVLIYGGANVKTVQLAMGHASPTITLNTYLGFWPDAVTPTRSLVDAALGHDSVTLKLSQ